MQELQREWLLPGRPCLHRFLHVLTKHCFMIRQITCFASCLFFPPTIHKSHNIPLPHFIMRMHIFPVIFSHILNLYSCLYFLSQCKNYFNLVYVYVYTVFNFNVLSNYQNHCMAMPIWYHMCAVVMATNFTFKIFFFYVTFYPSFILMCSHYCTEIRTTS